MKKMKEGIITMRKTRVFRASVSAILLTFFLLPAAANAANVTVSCPGGSGGTYSSIGAALAAIGQTGPSTITVTGTCQENVSLNDARSITIIAPTPGGATMPGGATIVGPLDTNAFDIAKSQDIALVNLEIRGTFSSTVNGGGEGVFMNLASEVKIIGCNIHDNQQAGVDANSGSNLFLRDTIIQNNTPNDGLDVAANSFAIVRGTTIQNNGDSAARGVGVFVASSSGVFFQLTNSIQNNADIGIKALESSTVVLAGGGTTIQGHHTNGIVLLEGSHLRIFSRPHLIQGNGAACPLDPTCGGIFATQNSTVGLAGTITGNQGSGISVQQGSNVQLNGATVSNNTGDGVHLQWISIGDFRPGNSITGNGGASVSCDRTSLAIGDLSAFSNVRCGDIEQPNGAQDGHEDEDRRR